MPSKSVAAPKEVLSRNTLAPTNGSPVDASVMLPEIFPDCAVRALEVTNNNKIYLIISFKKKLFIILLLYYNT